MGVKSCKVIIRSKKWETHSLTANERQGGGMLKQEMNANQQETDRHTADGLPRQGWSWTWRGVTTTTTLFCIRICIVIIHSFSFFAFLTPLYALPDALSLSLSLCLSLPVSHSVHVLGWTWGLWAWPFQRRGPPSDWTSGQ
ncbi:hypothetical protein BDP81DRAFT_12877 [Colletotrichum phormii]|uniref:Uncharacterized protein n=1 Tax=Colletotrichum phormii TaxID=359342 RepID=A0AAJ0A7G2_9PEZI|nr:uncharacterized protein BDP81DRAFT_12877 [Colletotrichum phormii]KAK1655945.1 hypothetical protein BDP81DRAFT_12877 [Colletotrichum phormii]